MLYSRAYVSGSINVSEFITFRVFRFVGTVKIRISAQGANLDFGPGGGALIFFF